MGSLGFGIVGTGLIAGVIADALEQSRGARLAAVSSRDLARGKEFAAKHGAESAVRGVDDLVALADVDAVYVATPTSTKEEVALAVIAAEKHVLVDKPMLSRASVQKMVDAARAAGVVFMDATHFVHHPRTHILKRQLADRVGRPRSLHTAFHFPSEDRENIRYQPSLEPMGAVGDMAWYSMRAVVEWLEPDEEPISVVAALDIDSGTGAAVGATGLLTFSNGKSSSFDVGYNVGSLVMDLALLGSAGVIYMDDFVLDRHNSFVATEPDSVAGFRHRTGVGSAAGAEFVECSASTPQHVAMLDKFSSLARAPAVDVLDAHQIATLRTQGLVDQIWRAAHVGADG